MKLTIDSVIKSQSYLDERDALKTVVKAMKYDTGLKDYALALNTILTGYTCEIIQVEAKIRKNYRVFNRIADGTRNFDVEISGLSYNGIRDQYIRFYGWLSDIWEWDGTNTDEIKERTYYRIYKCDYVETPLRRISRVRSVVLMRQRERK